MTTPRLQLLPRTSLIKTSSLDKGDWNYRPFLGYIQRQRFHLARNLIARGAHDSILEIGYGSGLFMPELSRMSSDLAGVDVHDKSGEVGDVLASAGIQVEVVQYNGHQVPFDDARFDCAVAISVLEFVEDLDALCLELKRVIKPSGHLVCVAPASSPLVDLGFRILTGHSAKDEFGESREELTPQLERHFACVDVIRRRLPPLIGVGLYQACRFSMTPRT